MKNPLGFNRLGSTPPDSVDTQAPTPEITTPTPQSAPSAPPKVHARRRRTALLLSAVAVIAVLMYTNRTPAPVSTPGEAAASTSSTHSLTPAMPTAQSAVLALMLQAQGYYKTHESYTGFSPVLTAGAKVSPAGQGIVISDDLGGVCAYSGMLGVTVNPVYIDPTAIACTQVSTGAPKAG